MIGEALAVAVLSAAGFVAASLLALAGGGPDARGRSFAVALAAGILVALASADLFPESIDLAGDGAIVGFVGGFALLPLVEILTRGHTHHSPDEAVGRHPVTPFVIGLAAHNLIDGFALGVSAKLSDVAVVSVGAGVLIHQVPVGISLAAVLAATGAPRATVLRNAGSLALLIPLAAAVTAVMPAPGDQALGTLVGVAAGVLMYLGASHLLPEAQSETHSKAPAMVFVGALAGTTALLLTVLHG